MLRSDMTDTPNWLLRGHVRRLTAMVEAPDGVRLATDCYVPADRPGPGPTIVERTPYDRRDVELMKTASHLAGHGYNVVLQDTRGRGDSEGMFQHYLAIPHEGEDGHALLDWIDRQEWSDGQVGTIGFSYTGSNQQSLAITNHPTLKSQVIQDAGINYFSRCVREDGAFVIGQLGTYALRMAITSPQARRDPVLRAHLEHVLKNPAEWYTRAPWRRGDSPVSCLPEYEDWLLHAQDNPRENARWRNPQMMIEPWLDQYPDIPKLLVTSWYGHHAWSNFRKLEAFAHHASPNRMIVGTWIHSSPYGEATVSGDVEFGDAASLNMDEIRRRWFDATLRGIEPGAPAAAPRITYFVMGGGTGGRDAERRRLHGGHWAQAQAWPPAGGGDLLLHLEAGGGLGTTPPAEAGRMRIAANLERPIPTIGSSIRNPAPMPGFISSGGCDQVERRDVNLSPGTGLPLTSRHDVAAFRSAPLEEAVEITGPLHLRLWLSSTSPACDLSVKIVDEYPPGGDWPAGFALNIADHYQRFASWTTLLDQDEGRPRLVEIGPIHLSNVFARGHRIRLQIGNSSWPRYDRNPEAALRFTFSIWAGGEADSALRGPGCLRKPPA